MEKVKILEILFLITPLDKVGTISCLAGRSRTYREDPPNLKTTILRSTHTTERYYFLIGPLCLALDSRYDSILDSWNR